MNNQIYFAFHSITLMDKMISSTKRKDGLTAVILAGATCETFLNDMQRWFQHGFEHKEKLSTKNEPKKPSLFFPQDNTYTVSIFNATTELEKKLAIEIADSEKNTPTTRKYTRVINVIKGVNEAGDTRFQELKRLFDIRNDIVHSKGLTIEIPRDDNLHEIQPTELNFPDFIRPLFKKKVLKLPSHHDTWLNLLDTSEFCDWVLSTVENAIYYVLDNLSQESLMSKHFIDSFYVRRKNKTNEPLMQAK